MIPVCSSYLLERLETPEYPTVCPCFRHVHCLCRRRQVLRNIHFWYSQKFSWRVEVSRETGVKQTSSKPGFIALTRNANFSSDGQRQWQKAHRLFTTTASRKKPAKSCWVCSLPLQSSKNVCNLDFVLQSLYLPLFYFLIPSSLKPFTLASVMSI